MAKKFDEFDGPAAAKTFWEFDKVKRTIFDVRHVEVLELTAPQDLNFNYLSKGWVLIFVFMRPNATFPTWVVGRTW